MKTMTFNLRCVYCADCDGINSFVHRAGMIFDALRRENADVIGFQELTAQNLAFLSCALGDLYTFYHVFRTAEFDGEGLAIAVRKGVFDMLGEDVYWLSETPLIPGSRFPEQSLCPRIALCVRLREIATGKHYHLTNVHLDHKDEQSRVLGMEAVLARMASADTFPGTEYLLLGDFNATPDSEVIKHVQKRGLVDLTDALTVTFHHFGKRDDCKIDYIFASRGLAATLTECYTVRDSHHGIYLSDHYPVVASFS